MLYNFLSLEGGDSMVEPKALVLVEPTELEMNYSNSLVEPVYKSLFTGPKHLAISALPR